MLAGIGQREIPSAADVSTGDCAQNYYVVTEETSDDALLSAFHTFMQHAGISVLVMAHEVAERLREQIAAYNAPHPLIVEVGSKTGN